jgi:hypothetical protein
MSPILGIIASSFRSAAGPDGAYDALATVTVPSGGLATITFAGIPNTYKHLQIRAIARCTFAADILDTYMTFNSDSTTSYRTHQLRGNGASATASDLGASTSSQVFVVPGTSIASSIFSGAIIDILDYANTSKNKTIRSLNGNDANGSGNIFFRSSLWINTSAINSLSIAAQATSSFTEYSQFTLYGIK